MTVDAIKEAIALLPESERHRLAAWLQEFDYDEWDQQMVADFSPGGRGIKLVERVEREIAEGEASLSSLHSEQELWSVSQDTAKKLNQP